MRPTSKTHAHFTQRRTQTSISSSYDKSEKVGSGVVVVVVVWRSRGGGGRREGDNSYREKAVTFLSTGK